MSKLIIILSFFLFWASCKNNPEPTVSQKYSVDISYAKGFSIDELAGESYLVTLNDQWRGEQTPYQYLLYKNEKPTGYDNVVKIKIPINKIACMSLTHIALIETIGMENTIVAASGVDYSHSKKVRELYENNQISEIGSQQALNYELLVDKSPDVVMAYGIDEQSLTYIDKLKKMGLVPILNAEYMEVHPLGKAEWIKYVAVFYDKLDEAESIFSSIEKEYNLLLSYTDTINNKPTVFVGMPWNGNWYVAGGKSFQARLFKDAGANYLWADNEEKSSIIKSKEMVLDEAFEADFWLNQNSYESIDAIIDYDEKLKNIKAVKVSNVYNNSALLKQNGGNDYWESATVQPHIVLKDLIEIFHPQLLEHKLYYYKKLK